MISLKSKNKIFLNKQLMVLIGFFVLSILLKNNVFAQASSVGGVLNNAGSNDFILNNRDLVIRNDKNKLQVRIDSETGDFRTFDKNEEPVILLKKKGSNLLIGNKNSSGSLLLFPKGVSNKKQANASIYIDGSEGKQRLGGVGTHGELGLVNKNNKLQVHLSGKTGKLTLTGKGAASGGIDNASIYVKSTNPSISLHDDTGGYERGWMVRSTRDGKLKFNSGNLTDIKKNAVVFSPNGTVCFGFCKKKNVLKGERGESLWITHNGLIVTNWFDSNAEIISQEREGSLHFNRKGGPVLFYSDLSKNKEIYFSPGRLSIGAPVRQMPNAKLVVGGTIGAKEIIVRPSGWADDVFDKDYSMLTANQLKEFIDVNNHLPGIPSEKSVMSDGLSIASFNANLLRNVEELTLRTIQQSNEIESLKKMLTALILKRE